LLVLILRTVETGIPILSTHTFKMNYLQYLIGITFIYCRNISLGAIHNNSTDITN